LDSSVDGHRIESISSQMLYYLHVLCGFIGVTVDLLADNLHSDNLFGRIKARNFLASGATSSFSKGPLLHVSQIAWMLPEVCVQLSLSYLSLPNEL
jgi:hypothetical protein